MSETRRILSWNGKYYKGAMRDRRMEKRAAAEAMRAVETPHARADQGAPDGAVLLRRLPRPQADAQEGEEVMGRYEAHRLFNFPIGNDTAHGIWDHQNQAFIRLDNRTWNTWDADKAKAAAGRLNAGKGLEDD